MTKRANGEGSIQRRKNGRWLAQITVGYKPDGKQVKRTVSGKTQQEVREKLDVLRRDRTDGRLIVTDGATLTMCELLDKWLSDVVAVNNSKNTHQLYLGVVRNQVAPFIGDIKLPKLATLHVAEMLAQLARKNVGARSRQLALRVVRSACKHAVQWRLLPFNPTTGIPWPKAPRREYSTLTADQIREFLAEAKKNRLYAFWYLAVVTGMRRGELAGLKWEDVDLKAGHLVIKRQIVYDNVSGIPRVTKAKTARSHRKIDLPAEALDVLKEHRAQSLREGYVAVPWVFVSESGTCLHATTLNRTKKRLLERSGVPHVRTHDLRHTHATLLLLGGIHPKIVQERLGHSNIAMTMDTYSHVLPSMQREAADKIGELIKAPA